MGRAVEIATGDRAGRRRCARGEIPEIDGAIVHDDVVAVDRILLFLNITALPLVDTGFGWYEPLPASPTIETVTAPGVGPGAVGEEPPPHRTDNIAAATVATRIIEVRMLLFLRNGLVRWSRAIGVP